MLNEDQSLRKGEQRATPNIDQALLKKMQGMFNFNLTHMSNLTKALPGSSVYESTQEAKAKHRDYCAKLEQDMTKTDAVKTRLAAKSANNAFEAITDIAGKEFKLANHQQSKLLNKVKKALQIKGTTDTLVRMQYGALMQEMSFSEVMSAIAGGDMEVAGALELPIIANKFKLKTDENRAKAFEAVTQEAVLGKEGVGELRLAGTAVKMLEEIGVGFVKNIEVNAKVITDIDNTIVNEAA